METISQQAVRSIKDADIPSSEKNSLVRKWNRLSERPLNILITGSTGSGKSSTINALLGEEVAVVGTGVAPETMDVAKYVSGNVILWDSPGLGDGPEADRVHASNLARKLKERRADGSMLIDLIIVVVDGGSRDLGTDFDMIRTVILPSLGYGGQDRVLVAINQADVAMKGRSWNAAAHQPERPLREYLDEKAVSVSSRIRESTGIDIETMYYSAGYKETGQRQEEAYNISELLLYISRHLTDKPRCPPAPLPVQGGDLPLDVIRDLLSGEVSEAIRTEHHVLLRIGDKWSRRELESTERTPLKMPAGGEIRIYGDVLYFAKGDSLYTFDVATQVVQKVAAHENADILTFNDRYAVVRDRRGIFLASINHALGELNKIEDLGANVRNVLLENEMLYWVRSQGYGTEYVVSLNAETREKREAKNADWGSTARLLAARGHDVFSTTAESGRREFGYMRWANTRTKKNNAFEFYKPVTRWVQSTHIVSDRYVIFSHVMRKKPRVYVLYVDERRCKTLKAPSAYMLDNLVLSGDILYGRWGGSVYTVDLRKGDSFSLRKDISLPAQPRSSAGFSTSTGCYITTAVCEEFGKADDCYELTVLRRFRDEWLAHQAEGPNLIEEYYRTAPDLVRVIDSKTDRMEIYQYINETYITRCVCYIEAGENEACKDLYCDMMQFLAAELASRPEKTLSRLDRAGQKAAYCPGSWADCRR